jgi:A/G-specific adenine glycosylase
MARTRPASLGSPTQAAILAWFDASGRSLPFRGVNDPYLVLVSEVMAQQTQISRVGDAWRTFTTAFPTAGALAAASPGEVLRAWRGLGYNRRALNLWRAARVIVDDHGGNVPSSVAELERLPGVGPYTARAVAAIAFGEPVGAVDTNVRRVIGRILTGDAAGFRPRELQAAADRSVTPERAADWTHALMDVGATFCRPTRPECAACPAMGWCRYAAGERTTAAPVTRRSGAAMAPAFSTSSRWLRGRILDRLRDAAPPGWDRFDGTIGEHRDEAVLAALTALAGEGLAELDPADPRVARLPER